MKLRCVVVEDSIIHKLAICKLIENHTNLELVASYSHAFEANQNLKTKTVDLIFLDVEMPDFSGFDLVENLVCKPQIIFTTANANHAVKAFDYEATDFLQKPFTSTRFQMAVEKALRRQSITIAEQMNDDQPHIFIKSNLVRHKINLSDILFVEALGDYVKVVTKTQSFTVLSTMKSMEDQLHQTNFFRIHKSFIVNLSKVTKVKGGELSIDQKIIPISRNKKNELKIKLSTAI